MVPERPDKVGDDLPEEQQAKAEVEVEKPVPISSHIRNAGSHFRDWVWSWKAVWWVVGTAEGIGIAVLLRVTSFALAKYLFITAGLLLFAKVLTSVRSSVEKHWKEKTIIVVGSFVVILGISVGGVIWATRLQEQMRPRLEGSLDFVELGHLVDDVRFTGLLQRVVIVYTVSVKALGSETTLDPSSIECSAVQGIFSGPVSTDAEPMIGKRITDIEDQLVSYGMGGEKILKHENWLEERAANDSYRVGSPPKTSKVACEFPTAHNIIALQFAEYRIAYKDAQGQQYVLRGRWAEPYIPIHNSDRRMPGLDERVPKGMVAKPILMVDRAGKVTPEGFDPSDPRWNTPSNRLMPGVFQGFPGPPLESSKEAVAAPNRRLRPGSPSVTLTDPKTGRSETVPLSIPEAPKRQ